jgi:hypothetical protein
MQTMDMIFNLEQMGIGAMGRDGDDCYKEFFGRFGRRVKRQSSYCGVTPVILNRVVNGLMFILWFLATGSILKRVALVWWGRVKRG